MKCYLCGKDAKTEEIRDTSRNERVQCVECPEYIVTSGALELYLDRTDGKILLFQEDTEKLIDFLQAWKKKSMVAMVTPELIWEITGK